MSDGGLSADEIHMLQSELALSTLALTSLQRLALTRMVARDGWLDHMDIGIARNIIGWLHRSGLIDRLPPTKMHAARYRINGAGLTALETNQKGGIP